MKKCVLLTLLMVFAFAEAYAGPATIHEASVFSQYRYDADEETGSFFMLAGARVDTISYDVYVRTIPAPAPSDVLLPHNTTWDLLGNFYADYFGTWDGFPEPENSSWERTYTFYVDDDGVPGFSENDTKYLWNIPQDSINRMDLVTNVEISGGSQPNVSWDSVGAANYYRVRLFDPNTGEALWQSELLNEIPGRQSFHYTGDLFNQYGALDVAIEANDGAGAEQDWLNRSRYVVEYNFPVFDSNSANIANGYFPFSVGDKLIRVGCTNTQYEGQVFYLDGTGIEEVDGIKCLKVNAVSECRLATVWFAQDAGGTVWALKVLMNGSGETHTLGIGTGIESPFMPFAPQVGDRAGLTVPESDEYFCEVTETGIAVPETCWGIGPFEGCLKVQCGQPPGLNEENEYFCPNFGPVKYGGHSETELKEIIRNNCPADLDRNGVIDGFDLATFAMEFGNTCP